MPKTINWLGMRFGKLVVLRAGPTHRRPNGKTVRQSWVQCDCGSPEKLIRNYHLSSRHTSHCGCMSKLTYHGHTVGGVMTSEYISWCSMRRRCSDPDHHNYRHYGGKGIKVWGPWLDNYANFLKDMGPKSSPDLTIDRIDSDKDYEPGNCRWATRLEQERNKKRARPTP